METGCNHLFGRHADRFISILLAFSAMPGSATRHSGSKDLSLELCDLSPWKEHRHPFVEESPVTLGVEGQQKKSSLIFQGRPN